ncbi:porin family protein [Confluentibacter lentus]|uniref:tRNA modification GTPase n=1 Tax=Confluentibacter lentus TaxID=1699412 RepID=UPI000C28BC1F|nr:tRNA modification GTPase [Confluentibacter lentus]
MRKNLLFIFTLLISIYSFSQISFEKGYYIDNSNQKIDCLIKNVDWKNNPTEFEYKLSDDSETEKLDINSVKEFSIFEQSKYVRAKVNIERSISNSTNALGTSGEPVFNEEELFLKVLIEGKSNLYSFSDGNLTKYFFNVDGSTIEQLIFIKYKTENSDIKLNQYYKQQLWLNLKCNDISMDDVNNIDFNKNDLINIFEKYNKCNQSEFVNYQSKEKGDMFNLSLRPRLNNSSLEIQTFYPASTLYAIDFGNNLNFGFGIELELILPFNKNKWGITIEPTYQNFKSEKRKSQTIIANVDYKSIEIPVGVRHYFFLNNKSKIFINGLFTIDLLFKSKLEYKRENGVTEDSLQLSNGSNLAFGIGCKYSNKYILELRHQTSRDILENYVNRKSSYNNSLSIIFGYTIF